MKTRTVGFFVFDGVVLLEFAGPLQVFDVAARVAVRRGLAASPPFQPVVISRSGAAVRTREGVGIQAQASLQDHPPLDLVIVAGGALQAELAAPEVAAWLRQVAGSSEVTGSVCVGSFLLGRAGLLDQREATTHFEDTEDLRAIAPAARVSADRLWIDEGAIVTSGGFAAGIDMALHLVERLLGAEIAAETARQLEYRRRNAADRQA
ncbi:MAG: AraC family transcriptional regulator [Delftia sp.]|uniref:GlxA family transcriptional regulator n=1 Tax=Delftia TaxID=80865 RepID=UPI00115042E9|nr:MULTISPECIES: AraC family transcriptional regulator [Delftia]MPT04090.1 AraC family transcriptional regulator [Delftia sp.]TQL65683.1 DJ-1/PfpI family protein [Delftia sp. HK171]WAT86527.1 AraC family transcriptional regulator [Delftia acidovorans]